MTPFMDRRAFIGTVSGCLLAAPLAAGTQPAGDLPRIGHLAIAGTTSSPQPPSANWDAFLAGLRDGGYVEGQNFAFEHRDAHNRPELFPAAAAELVRAGVRVIFARGGQAVRAAKQATSAIPIVAIDLETDPIAAHFVTSLRRPGGNVTGMFLDLADLSGKHVELLKEMVPTLTRLAVVGDPDVNRSQFQATQQAGRILAVAVDPIEIRRASDIQGVFRITTEKHDRALIVGSSPLVLAYRAEIADLATRHHLPTMFVYRFHVDAGGLLSYGPDLPEMFHHCGQYVARVLAGAKPAEMPVERPTKFELVINLKTAKALGLTIPQSLLQRADQVIE
ncbi:MAG TPA: ABC transporter substrate-binding protein [Methylomirabilota bacterium]|nr:ABC transporter substrate-binding protein [Methylomirabilota bacterium]